MTGPRGISNADTLATLLEQLAAEISDPVTVAVCLVGSHSRGMAITDSDIDLTRFVEELPPDPADRFVLHLREGWLVSILTTTLADLAHSLTQPDRAVWTVPYLRDARLLRDPQGRLVQLQRQAVAFEWAPLQAQADSYASQRLLKFAAEAWSLTGALGRGDAVQTATETTWLVLGLPLVVAVRRGIFLLNETRAPGQVQQAVGLDSPWATSYRVAAGLEPDADGQTAVRARGLAALHLYAATVALLRPVLHPEHASIVDADLARARAAGVLGDSDQPPAHP